jgi:SHS2 domain-containing protein
MDTNKPNFTLLDHTADLGIKVYGTGLKNLFEAAAKSMMQIMVRIKGLQKTRRINLSVDAEDLSDLMVRWLGEILYLFEGEKEVVIDLGIDAISQSHLDATLETVPLNQDLHDILCEIKAVTYHQIEVTRKNKHWEARVIFDL